MADQTQPSLDDVVVNEIGEEKLSKKCVIVQWFGFY